jgi:hypothetical protein
VAKRLCGTPYRHRPPRVSGPNLIFGESHLQRVLASYAGYYNQARTHLALQKDAPLHREIQRSGVIIAIPILAGLRNQYIRMRFSERTTIHNRRHPCRRRPYLPRRKRSQTAAVANFAAGEGTCASAFQRLLYGDRGKRNEVARHDDALMSCERRIFRYLIDLGERPERYAVINCQCPQSVA